MIRRIISRKIDKAERDLGESNQYLRFILQVSLSAFLCFSKIFAIANYRKTLPLSIYHVARIVAARDEGCGSCVQLEINLALKAGVTTEILQFVIDGQTEHLPANLSLAYYYVEAVVKKLPTELKLREEIKSLIGDHGLVELALAVGASRFLPIVKRTLGYGTACSQVKLTIDK